MRRTAVVLVLVAACSGGSKAAPTTTASASATTRVTLRIVVAPSGLGCTANTPTGRGKTLVVKDQGGTVVATAAVGVTPGADSCDFTASFDVPDEPKFLTVDGDRGQIVTLNPDQWQGGKVRVNVDGTGAAAVA